MDDFGNGVRDDIFEYAALSCLILALLFFFIYKKNCKEKEGVCHTSFQELAVFSIFILYMNHKLHKMLIRVF